MNASPNAETAHLFHDPDEAHAFLKAGIMGEAGAGKTRTSSDLSIGLVQHMRDLKVTTMHNRVAFVDTENGAAWVKGRFKSAGIHLKIARTRALADLRESIAWAEANADVLIIDSITHFWRLFCEEYAAKKKRTRGLEMFDWGIVKQDWRINFTDPYLNSRLHIIMCGRQGYEYDMQENDAGKKELIKTGVKMRAEGETGYEPSLLVQMEAEQTIEKGRVVKIENIATVFKDRADVINGKVFVNPTFQSFLPHIETLNIGGAGVSIDTSRSNDSLFVGDETKWRREQQMKDICLEEIEAEIVRKWPGQAAADKAAKADFVEKVFGTRSWTAVQAKPLLILQQARNAIWVELRGVPYGAAAAAAQPKTEAPKDDQSTAQPKAETPAATDWVQEFSLLATSYAQSPTEKRSEWLDASAERRAQLKTGAPELAEKLEALVSPPTPSKRRASKKTTAEAPALQAAE